MKNLRNGSWNRETDCPGGSPYAFCGPFEKCISDAESAVPVKQYMVKPAGGQVFRPDKEIKGAQTRPFSCCQVILEQQGSIAFVFIRSGTDVRLTQRRMPADLAAPVAEIPVKIIRIRFPAFHIISGCPDHKRPDLLPYRFVSKIRRSRFGKGFGMDGGNFVRAAAAVSIFLVRMANLSFVKAVVCRFLPVL